MKYTITVEKVDVEVYEVYANSKEHAKELLPFAGELINTGTVAVRVMDVFEEEK